MIEQPDGRFLLAQRPEGKVYAGYWEFPGGKVEPGETNDAALSRELHEELGIEIEESYPWITRTHVYEHASVRLHFLRVARWRGEFEAKEGQAFTWTHIDPMSVSPMLPANGPVFRALSLRTFMAVTPATGDLTPLIRNAIERGVKMIQIRRPGASRDELRRIVQSILERDGDIRIFANSDMDTAHDLGVGLHLTAERLMRLRERPAYDWIGASCHNADEIAQANRLGMDYVVIGPVKPTATHPGAAGIGWPAFAQLAVGLPMPVFAIGGLSVDDLHVARKHGAHGIAAIRAAWTSSLSQG